MARPERDYLRADSDDEMAQAIARLLDDGDLRERLGRDGRFYVERHHQWGDAAGRLEAHYGAARADGPIRA